MCCEATRASPIPSADVMNTVNDKQMFSVVEPMDAELP